MQEHVQKLHVTGGFFTSSKHCLERPPANEWGKMIHLNERWSHLEAGVLQSDSLSKLNHNHPLVNGFIRIKKNLWAFVWTLSQQLVIKEAFPGVSLICVLDNHPDPACRRGKCTLQEEKTIKGVGRRSEVLPLDMSPVKNFAACL